VIEAVITDVRQQQDGTAVLLLDVIDALDEQSPRVRVRILNPPAQFEACIGTQVVADELHFWIESSGRQILWARLVEPDRKLPVLELVRKSKRKPGVLRP
jgi:hypothetical protein